jgi:opacity protein-like surface antigen
MKLTTVYRLIQIVLFLVAVTLPAHGQRDRAQIPAVFNNSYININVGYINYPFGASTLEPGYTYRSVNVPHVAVRIIMAGHEFNKYLSAQLSYMRPVLWVKYTYDKGSVSTEETKSVWMNIAGATVRPQLPLTDHFTVFGEGGLGIITRHGITDNSGNAVVTNTTYPYYLLGGGIKYLINDGWRLTLSGVYSPEKKSVRQPATSYLSAGFEYMMHTLPADKIEERHKAGYLFPKQILMVGYASNLSGYGVNRFFSNDKFPVFWLGDAYVSEGFSLDYIRNIYHGKKIFSFDWGASLGIWKGKNGGDMFMTLSLYPEFKWTLIHSKPADIYLMYSLAGPTFITANRLDGQELGGEFTFRDAMGAGLFMGSDRKFNVEFRIAHFSNGNLYPRNAGICIPLSLSAGYSF